MRQKQTLHYLRVTIYVLVWWQYFLSKVLSDTIALFVMDCRKALA